MVSDINLTCKLWLNLHVEKFSLGEVLIRFEISRCFKLNLATMVHHTLLTSVLWNSCSKCNRSQMFFKIDFLNNFVIFTGKYLCWSLFLIKLTPTTLKRLQHRCFLVNISKFLIFISIFFKEILTQMFIWNSLMTRNWWRHFLF